MSSASALPEAEPAAAGGRPTNKRPAPRGTAAYPRKRAVTACQVCRARRTKCDNAKPACSFCQKVGAQCVQSPVDLSSFDPASLRILERLDELELAIHSSATGNPPIIAYPTQSVSETVKNDVSECIQLLPANLEDLLISPCFVGPEARATPLLQLLSQSRLSTPWSPPESSSADLEPRSTTVLLDNFFKYCHVKNPILNEPGARRVVAQVSLHGVDWSPQSCLVLLICALGAISTPFGDSGQTMPGTTAYCTAQSYFQAAQKRLGSLVATAGVVEAQCLFLAGVYSMCIFRPSHAWRFFSQALACCQEFEFLVQAAPIWMNTEAFETQQEPQRLSVAEQAIYWSSWKSEREMRQDLQPHDFGLLDSERAFYPPFFPTPPPAEELDEFMDILQRERQRTGWYFYLTEISLRRLASRIAQDVLSFKPLPYQTVLQRLEESLTDREAKIDEWLSALPLEMSLQTPAEVDDVTKFVIRGHLNNLYEMIYWPFLDAYITSLEEKISRKNLSPGQAGLEIQSRGAGVGPNITVLAEAALNKHLERIHLNRPGFKHRHHGTWPMIRTCTRSAAMLLKTALTIQEHNIGIGLESSLQLPPGWQEAVADVIELNRYWEAEVSDAHYRVPLLEAAWHRLQR